MEKEFTYPQCESCSKHDELDKKVIQAIHEGNEAIARSEENIKGNREEHNKILTNIDRLAGDIKWITTISKMILVTIAGYFIGLGVFIFTNDYASKDDVRELNSLIERGEELHYSNEKTIHTIEGKLDILVDHARTHDAR